MNKQYLAQFRHNGYEPESWFNCKPYVTEERGNFFKTLEEAQDACRKIYDVFPDREHTTVQKCGCIGIESHTDATTAHRMAVAETRIRVREVTEWEVVE